MRLRGTLACFVVVASLTACSLLVSTSGLTEGDGGEAQDDASRDSSSGSSSGSSGGSSGSGGLDGGVGEAATGDASLCSVAHDLCDDFSGTTFPDLTRWTTFERAGQSTGTRVTDDFVSGPASFRAQAVEWDSVNLMKSFSGAVKRLVCEFSANVKSQTTGTPVLRSFHLDAVPTTSSGLDSYRLAFVAYPTAGGAIDEFWTSPSASGGRRDGPAVIPTDQWMRVRLDLKTESPASMTISYNGDFVGKVDLPKFPAFDALLVRFGGLTEVSAGHGGTVNIDDVVCDVTR
jgi:hypothetical protein